MLDAIEPPSPARVEALGLISDAIAQATAAQAALHRLAWHWEKDIGNEALRATEAASLTLAKAAKVVKRAEKEAASAEKLQKKADELAEKEAARLRVEREACLLYTSPSPRDRG